MKIIKIAFLLIAINLIFFNCKTKPKTYLNEAIYINITAQCPDLRTNDIVVYYFDGNCSFCIMKLIEIEKKLKEQKNLKAIFIAKTDNPGDFRYNIKSAAIKSCIIIEQNNEYSRYLKFNEVIEVKKNRETQRFL